MANAEAGLMKKEVGFLNAVCILVAVVFIGLAILNALTATQLLTTDNLFVITVCLVMALMFGINPLLYLKSEGRLPIPFAKRLARRQPPPQVGSPPSAPPLLDAKGRAVPPDVRQIAARFGPTQTKDA